MRAEAITNRSNEAPLAMYFSHEICKYVLILNAAILDFGLAERKGVDE